MTPRLAGHAVDARFMFEARKSYEKMQPTGGVKLRKRRSGFGRRRRQRRARAAALCVISLIVVFCVWCSVALHGWRHTTPARSSLPQYPDPPGIVLHASLSPGKVHGVPIDAARLEEIHAEDHPNWATTFEGKVYHIGYHYVILPDGTVQQGRPDHCIGCHAPHYNTWLGICVVGCFDPSVHRHWKPSRPTAAQFAALISLCERLMSQYHIPPENVLRHRDTKQTWCPGRRFPYEAVMAKLKQYAVGHPETRARQYAVARAIPENLLTAGEGR